MTRELAARPRPLAPVGDYLRRIEDRDGATREVPWKSSTIVDLTAKCICQPCNGGWVNYVESAALSCLSPMMKGLPVRLGPSDQERLALWVAVRAAVMRYAHSPVVPVSAEALRHLYAFRRCPPSWSVWLAAYNGSFPTYYHGDLVETSPPTG